MHHDSLIKRLTIAKFSRLEELDIRTKLLMEIVELHQPEEIIGERKTQGLYCQGCNQDYYEEWPCPTYKLIEKGLK